jgi:hypothetical protein
MEEPKRKLLFEFRDKSKQIIRKNYIIQFRGDLTDEGEPTIVLNDFPLGLKGDKNPVINLVLVYSNIDERDEDLQALKDLID